MDDYQIQEPIRILKEDVVKETIRRLSNLYGLHLKLEISLVRCLPNNYTYIFSIISNELEDILLEPDFEEETRDIIESLINVHNLYQLVRFTTLNAKTELLIITHISELEPK